MTLTDVDHHQSDFNSALGFTGRDENSTSQLPVFVIFIIQCKTCEWKESDFKTYLITEKLYWLLV